VEIDAVAERFVKVVNKMLISKLSFRQAGHQGEHTRAERHKRGCMPHAAFPQVTSMLFFEQELQYH
jgi:hypothetical protein